MGRRRRSLLESRGSSQGSSRLDEAWTADVEEAIRRDADPSADKHESPADPRLDDEPSDIEVPIAALSPAPLRFSGSGFGTGALSGLGSTPGGYNPGAEPQEGETAYPAPVPGTLRDPSFGNFENVLRGPLANDGAPLSVDDALRRDARIPSPAPNLEPTPPILHGSQGSGAPFPQSSTTPTGSQVRSLSGYERPRAQAVDAPVASDLFGEGPGYEDFESSSPPTDDYTPHVLEDVGQPYATPYTVPEPPPIPGILDRFTPPPAQRTEIGSRRKKPEYLAETPQAKARYEPTPSPERRKLAPRPEEARKEETPGVSPFALFLGIGTVLLVVGTLLALLIGLMVVLASGGNEEDDSLIREPVSGVEIRDGLRSPEEGTDRPAPETTEIEVPERPGAQPGVPANPDEPVLVVGPPKLPTGAMPEPEPEPVPEIKPAPAPAPPPVAIEKGTLKIRSNRRVLVYVNGQAVGYTPTEWEGAPGTYNVVAMIPGQPNTKQSRPATITNEHPSILVDFSF